MDGVYDWEMARALLEWQVELGATEAIGDAPVNRYEVPAEKPKPKAAPAAPVARVDTPVLNPVDEAARMAAAATSLPALRDALAEYPHCDLRKGARNTVFSDGQAGARVMVVGEVPGREENREGRAFVGASGQLLDRMLAAIDLDRGKNVYLSHLIPWRPSGDRDPTRPEIEMLLPFVKRHIELAEPEIVVLLGSMTAQALAGPLENARLRGHWVEVTGRPAMPTIDPSYLLRNPAAKRQAWADLLEIRARLDA